MKVILALDIGSSSIRCTAYPFDSSSISSPIASSALPCRSVEPNTGKISLHMDIMDGSLLDKIDQSVLKVLNELPEDVAVVAVGFSSLVMNLIGVDRHGTPLGDDFTLSYACNTPNVAKECQSICQQDRCVDLEHDYHQSTGATFHPAYALGQLRVIYKTRSKEKLDLIRTWQTLASLSLCRWTGQVSLPISYSEASWTGLLNFQMCECIWQEGGRQSKAALFERRSNTPRQFHLKVATINDECFLLLCSRGERGWREMEEVVECCCVLMRDNKHIFLPPRGGCGRKCFLRRFASNSVLWVFVWLNH